MAFFLRFQSAVPNRHGKFPGVFALANGLAHDGLLSEVDLRWWASANARMQAAYASTADDPLCYDPSKYPNATSWFKDPAATDLIAKTREYLSLLDRYGVPWVEQRTTTPGPVHYEDDVQIVATPYLYPDHWPFPTPAPES